MTLRPTKHPHRALPPRKFGPPYLRCEWEEFTEPDDRGWRQVRCTRCGFVTRPTPHPFRLIFRECSVQHTEPGLLTKCFYLTKAVAKAIKTRKLRANWRQVRQRFEICRACPQFLPHSKEPDKLGKCAICGCGITRKLGWFSKLSWKTERCPDEPPRWLPIIDLPHPDVPPKDPPKEPRDVEAR